MGLSCGQANTYITADCEVPVYNPSKGAGKPLSIRQALKRELTKVMRFDEITFGVMRVRD